MAIVRRWERRLFFAGSNDYHLVDSTVILSLNRQLPSRRADKNPEEVTDAHLLPPSSPCGHVLCGLITFRCPIAFRFAQRTLFRISPLEVDYCAGVPPYRAPPSACSPVAPPELLGRPDSESPLELEVCRGVANKKWVL